MDKLTDKEFYSLGVHGKLDAYKALCAELTRLTGNNRQQRDTIIGLGNRIRSLQEELVTIRLALQAGRPETGNLSGQPPLGSLLYSKQQDFEPPAMPNTVRPPVGTKGSQLYHAALLVRNLCDIAAIPAVTEFVEKTNPWLKIADEV